MPHPEPSATAEIEAKQPHSIDACDGVAPAKREVVPLGPFDRGRMREWLEAVGAELDPIRTWLP